MKIQFKMSLENQYQTLIDTKGLWEVKLDELVPGQVYVFKEDDDEYYIGEFVASKQNSDKNNSVSFKHPIIGNVFVSKKKRIKTKYVKFKSIAQIEQFLPTFCGDPVHNYWIRNNIFFEVRYNTFYILNYRHHNQK